MCGCSVLGDLAWLFLRGLRCVVLVAGTQQPLSSRGGFCPVPTLDLGISV